MKRVTKVLGVFLLMGLGLFTGTASGDVVGYFKFDTFPGGGTTFTDDSGRGLMGIRGIPSLNQAVHPDPLARQMTSHCPWMEERHLLSMIPRRRFSTFWNLQSRWKPGYAPPKIRWHIQGSSAMVYQAGGRVLAGTNWGSILPEISSLPCSEWSMSTVPSPSPSMVNGTISPPPILWMMAGWCSILMDWKWNSSRKPVQY